MKLKRLFMMLVLGFTSYIGLTNKHIVKGIISLEKPQGDLFTSINNGRYNVFMKK